ncbi:MAG: hypothetical protein IT383_22075 [Deltaproteobacteria bacterium]|nr:hypothetical protein [Deltaproteobacteria bacterium]
MSTRPPSESVDVLAGELRDPELPRRRARRLCWSALVVAGAAWLATLGAAIWSSETNGITASWFAIFPTGFGTVGLLSLSAAKGAGASLRNALLAGCAGSLSLWAFFEAIWPAL